MADGKRILLTGAAGSLGQEAARQLAAKGHEVFGLDIREAPQAPAAGFAICDVSDPSAVADAVKAAEDALGGIDVVVNNAGVLSLEHASRQPTDGAERDSAVNLHGAWNVVAAAMPALRASGGRVVNVSSLFAVVNASFIPGYAASKRALGAYSDILRFEEAGNISVVTVYPSFIDTPIHDPARAVGLSVKRLVTFSLAGRTLFTLEESVGAAARGLVRATLGTRGRDRGLTRRGGLTLFTARHFPRFVDGFMRWRLGWCIRRGLEIDTELGRAGATPA